MELDQQTLKQLSLFKKELEEFVRVTNTIYGIVNRRRYVEDKERETLWAKEQKLQPEINGLYGSLEDTITALVGYKPMVGIPSIPGASWDVFQGGTLGRLSQFNDG